MPFSSRRTLVQALIFSLLIHAVLLLSVVRLLPLQLDAPATTISVEIREARRADSAKPVSAPAAKPLAAPVRPPSPLVRKSPVQQIVVARTAADSLAALPTQPVARDAGPAAPTAPSPAATSAGGAVAAAVPEPVREGFTADDMRQCRVSLAVAARRFKRYPALARERGWEGTAEVALNFNALLSTPEVVLVRSSGRAVLDEQALEMISQAARVTILPEGLKGRDFRIQLPVKFSLDDSQ